MEEAEYEGMYAYIILQDDVQIYISRGFDDQMDALRRGREDAIKRNAKGENVEYDIVRVEC